MTTLFWIFVVLAVGCSWLSAILVRAPELTTAEQMRALLERR